MSMIADSSVKNDIMQKSILNIFLLLNDCNHLIINKRLILKKYLAIYKRLEANQTNKINCQIVGVMPTLKRIQSIRNKSQRYLLMIFPF